MNVESSGNEFGDASDTLGSVPGIDAILAGLQNHADDARWNALRNMHLSEQDRKVILEALKLATSDEERAKILDKYIAMSNGSRAAAQTDHAVNSDNQNNLVAMGVGLGLAALTVGAVALIAKRGGFDAVTSLVDDSVPRLT